ncbi:toxin glutamine deamidase domain-containing protein [Micromonospora sp. NPDC000089]|uniref:toxin glutamine deamidase domain-containing protein n=1 Tax=unclassified Micromonospora TaxID=2617518 RepID=UPI003687B98B
MTVLPSPIPHPLDFCPWDLPGWVYEALDWVIGVEWPEGDERAVWDVADQWYGVPDALVGPRDDAHAAAGDVRSGYGGIGAVAEAFDTAWRRVAEGDEAPLPVLIAVAADLGRLVEECGCDIEGAKLEVWIELGILVVELVSLAVAAVLTAGAASPAAGAAITATRFVVQQIFKRLMAQLAKKALKQGLKEAGERAAKELAKDGARGLARRAVRAGLFEAGEEAGVSLATQAYQNGTGRGHGLDLADVGASALGGFAGGTVAPLAGLGRHATGRWGKAGEHLGREMTGETLAETAAGFATGQGLGSLEDTARAAVSGVSGSATGQVDEALHHRLEDRLHSLAVPITTDLPVPPPPPATLGSGGSSTAVGPDHAGAGGDHPRPTGSRADMGPSIAVPEHAMSPVDHNSSPVVGAAVALDGGLPAKADLGPGPLADGSVAAAGNAGHHVPDQQGGPMLSESPVPAHQSGPMAPSVGLETASASSATADSARTSGGLTLTSTAVSSAAGVVGPSSEVAPGPGPQSAAVPNGTVHGVNGGANPSSPHPVLNTAPPASSPAPVGGGGAGGQSASPAWAREGAAAASPHRMSALTQTVPPVHQQPGAVGDGDRGPAPRHPRFPLLEALAPTPTTSSGGDVPPLSPPPPRPHDAPPRRRHPEWDAARAAEREAFDRRRYQGNFEAQRRWFEDKRRSDEAAHRESFAAWHEANARRATQQAIEMQRDDRIEMASWFRKLAVDELQEAKYQRDLAADTLAGAIVPETVAVSDPADFDRLNEDVAEFALGAVETTDVSALTGDDDPPPIDRSRRYGQVGGLRPPLALHQTDLEREMPRSPDGTVVRTADPRLGGWFELANDGGPRADATRGINCLDCTLSLYDTWVHGRPRVSAPRTFDGYLHGDVDRPIMGEHDGPRRVEEVTGGRFQRLTAPPVEGPLPPPAEMARAVDRGYRNLRDQLKIGGHGSYAFLVTEWKGGGSHAWVALNQNGTVLFLDPQNGTLADRPLYGHDGTPEDGNVVAVDVLILGGDGLPMPLGGLARGRWSVLPDLPNYPPAPDDHHGHGDPYLNRMHLLEGPAGGQSDGAAESPDGTTNSADKSVLWAQTSPDERQALESLHANATVLADRVESALASTGERVSEAVGGPLELRDKEFRLKSLDSLVRKFLDEAAAVGLSVEDFARDVNDVLRFCMVVPSGQEYGLAVALILDDLRSSGFEVADRSCKNFWRSGNRFYGFNCTIRSPEGQLFELQIHTEASRSAWQATHDAYEVLRRSSRSPASRVHAFLEMLSMNRRMGMPEEVLADLADRFPAKDASFGKWIHGNKGVWQEFLNDLAAEGRGFAELTRRYGLTAKDFPISPDLLDKMEQASVELLRSVPRG